MLSSRLLFRYYGFNEKPLAGRMTMARVRLEAWISDFWLYFYIRICIFDGSWKWKLFACFLHDLSLIGGRFKDENYFWKTSTCRSFSCIISDIYNMLLIPQIISRKLCVLSKKYGHLCSAFNSRNKSKTKNIFEKEKHVKIQSLNTYCII